MEEEIGKLEGVPAVEKTIEEYAGQSAEEGETARTLDILGVAVQFLDGQDSGDHLVIDENTLLAVENPVPVYNVASIAKKDENLIGHAALYVEGKVLKGDLFLDYHTPERLALDNDEKLYPALIGAVDVVEKGHVKDCKVIGISLTKSQNVDKRISPVK